MALAATSHCTSSIHWQDTRACVPVSRSLALEGCVVQSPQTGPHCGSTPATQDFAKMANSVGQWEHLAWHTTCPEGNIVSS
jgi:hypothetical protein